MCLGRRPIADGAENAGVVSQEVAKLALDPSATARETHTFASQALSHNSILSISPCEVCLFAPHHPFAAAASRRDFTVALRVFFFCCAAL